MLQMQIDVNIPFPARANWKAELGKLGVGESLSFGVANRSSVSNSVSAYYHKLTHKRFTISADPVNEAKLRVWRIS